MSTRSHGSPVETSVAGRLFYGVTGYFVVPSLMAWDGVKIAAHWVWKAPKVVKLILVILAVLSVVGGTFVVIRKMAGWEQAAIMAEWDKYKVAARSADEKELLAILDTILAKDPENRDALTRKAAIESGEGDPADPGTLAIILRIHLKNGRKAEALREAKKMYTVEPKDWMANCILGQEAIARKDEQSIQKHLAVVEDPATGSPDLGGLLYALELHKQAGKDATILRTFTVNKVIPNLKNANLATIHAAGRVQILVCFIDSCLSIADSSVPNLLEYWSWSTRLADGILDDAREAKNAQILSQLGTLQPPLGGVLARFQKLNVMSELQAKEQMKGVEDRARRIWRAIRVVDPKNPQGYVGEAYALLRAKDSDGAIAQIMAGVAGCGEWNMSLLIAATAWAKEAKQTEPFLPKLLELTKRFPENVTLWHLVAETAEAANRRDIAIEAVQRAREKAPTDVWLLWAEARMWLDADKHDKAFELLQMIPEKNRVGNPAVVRAYTRALAAAGDDKLLREVAKAAFNEGDKSNDASLALAPALGLLDCPPTKARAQMADGIADRVHGRWPTSLDAVRAQARACVQLAEEVNEKDNRRWSEVPVQAAIETLNKLKSRDPTDVWAPAMLAWVRYQEGKEDKQPVERAWNELTLVLPREADPTLPADVLEVIGTLYFAREKYVEAVSPLTRAAAAARQPAGPLVTLALAQYKQGDVRTARETLRRAANYPQSDRVRDEYLKAATRIFKE
jgi:tetratricopeptide (TPR) repeat protein